MSIKKIKEDVFGIAEIYQDNKKQTKQLSEANKVLKEEIIGLLQQAGLSELFNEIYIVKYSIPKSFDTGLFKMDNPELAKQFIKEKKVGTIVDVVNKKGLLKQYPAIYNQYLVAGTPRLTIKGGF